LLPDFYSGATGLSGCFVRDFLSGAYSIGWLASIVFRGVVKDVKPWHSGYNIEFAPAFTTKHRE
jgi:hypothetical protein